ncbi:hypothetical protein TRM7557_00370 [Tritonibacter multivorans]|uniref:Integral membrane protein n=1 Tax=Tritonibacter multivorans TaxID=928856 RepID=A0A0P1GML8_9RHOB|nr:DUF2244 domain-containing protein [Tritonibacter multivorans]MDA7419409.1 DUF2244 domain-containing protein [Tritonibacter multivorans]CUH75402.1 hypothetical protein TRM7557_00370 [Tritonibacter multivorans]SFC68181.1 Uncharacterized membrane protein [Tritonibacter multivorans]
MPYDWTKPPTPDAGELHLWPHQSLTPKGYAGFLAVTALLIALPLLVLLGSVLLWGLLPFLALALFGMKFALDRNRAHAQVLEVLTLGPDEATLVRRDRQGEQQWSCNRYWAQVTLHPHEGPVPHYVTLKGGGREVEIGAFLSEDERKALFDDLRVALGKP